MKKRFIGAIAAMSLVLSAMGHAQETQPRGYMIANYDIKDQAGFQKYMDAAGSLAPKYHGTVTVFNLNATAVEGHLNQSWPLLNSQVLQMHSAFITPLNIPQPGNFALHRRKAP